MAKMRKGQKLSCVPCGREVVVDACGTSATTIWCCGAPMKSGKKKAAKRKPAKKK